jgi:ferredoxin
MPYEIVINRELCGSNAECVAVILDAERACPVDAITLIDHDGDQAWS